MEKMDPFFARGMIVGALFACLIILATSKVMDKFEAPQPLDLMPKSVIDAYNQGIKDALRTNPVSMELEMVCLEIWANKQPKEK